MTDLDPRLSALIERLPKVELHVHIEGTLEPEFVFKLAKRNGITLPWANADALRVAYRFDDLQAFLDLYYANMRVLVHPDDFYDLAMAYFRRAHADRVVHTEIFFDPQAATERGVPLAAVLEGLLRARDDARDRYGIGIGLIPCFLRHLSEESALSTLEALLPYRDELLAVGLDSSERDHPPAKFQRVFAAARDAGLRAVAHAGEEGPAANVRDALELLHVERIDHGVRCIDDDALVARLAETGVPLTVCPLSNLALRVVDDLADHPLKRLLHRGVRVTVNSDDPAYFGGYIGDNFRAAAAALELSAADIVQLADNAACAAFLPDDAIARLRADIEDAATG